MRPQTTQNLSDMFDMIFKGLTIDDDVIYVGYTVFISHIRQAAFHEPLKLSGGVHQPEWDSYPFVQAPWCHESCEMSFRWMDKTLVIGFSLIYQRKPVVSAKVFKSCLYSRQWVSVGNCPFIQLTIVDAQTETAILLPDAHHR